jgi:hypothetical protein
MNKCNLCNLEFFSKQSLKNHENKKIKCNIESKFKCNKCNKFFRQKKNMNYHNNICKINNILINNTQPIILDPKNDIYNILNLEVSNEEKFNLIKIINNEINYDKMLEILNYNLSIETKISLLLKFKKEIIKDDNYNESNKNNEIENDILDDKKINYIYLIQERENYETNKNIYKFGKTSQYANNKIRRLQDYKKGSKIIMTIECGKNINEIETQIRNKFKTEFISNKDGHEYFEGDCLKMKKIINSIIENNY